MSRKNFGFGRVALAGVLMLGLSACGAQASSSEAGEGLDKLTYALVPTSEQAVTYLAEREGIFKKHGLDVTFTQVNSSSALTAAVMSGQADIMAQSLSMVSAVSTGVPVQMVVPLTSQPLEGQTETLVLKDSEIKSFADLAGKDVSTIGAQGVFEMTTRNALEAAGGDPASMKGVPMAPGDDIAALEAGRVDAATVGEPWLTTAKDSGKFRSLGAPAGKLDFRVFSSAVFATKQTIQEKGEQLQRFRDAVKEAAALVADDDDLAREVISGYSSLDPKALKHITLPDVNPDIDVDSLKQIISKVQAYGWLKRPVTVEEFVWDVALKDPANNQ